MEELLEKSLKKDKVEEGKQEENGDAADFDEYKVTTIMKLFGGPEKKAPVKKDIRAFMKDAKKRDKDEEIVVVVKDKQEDKIKSEPSVNTNDMHACGDFKAELMKTAQEICALGKGILAADESTGTIGKRFATIEVENTHENRQAYRELLFKTVNIEEYISGVIMFDETVRDKTVDGTV